MLDLHAIFEQGSHERSESLVDSIVDARDSVAYCGGSTRKPRVYGA